MKKIVDAGGRLGEIDPITRRHLDHLIMCKEKAIKTGFYGFAAALCKLHEAIIVEYLDEHKPYNGLSKISARVQLGLAGQKEDTLKTPFLSHG